MTETRHRPDWDMIGSGLKNTKITIHFKANFYIISNDPIYSSKNDHDPIEQSWGDNTNMSLSELVRLGPVAKRTIEFFNLVNIKKL